MSHRRIRAKVHRHSSNLLSLPHSDSCSDRQTNGRNVATGSPDAQFCRAEMFELCLIWSQRRNRRSNQRSSSSCVAAARARSACWNGSLAPIPSCASSGIAAVKSVAGRPKRSGVSDDAPIVAYRLRRCGLLPTISLSRSADTEPSSRNSFTIHPESLTRETAGQPIAG